MKTKTEKDKLNLDNVIKVFHHKLKGKRHHNFKRRRKNTNGLSFLIVENEKSLNYHRTERKNFFDETFRNVCLFNSFNVSLIIYKA